MRIGFDRKGSNSLVSDFDPDKGLTAGARWEDELYRRLQLSAAVVAVLTPERARLAPALCGSRARAFRRQAGLSGWNERRPTGAGRFPTHSMSMQWVIPKAMRLLSRSLREFGIAAGDSFAWDLARPVYPGAAFRDKMLLSSLGAKPKRRPSSSAWMLCGNQGGRNRCFRPRRVQIVARPRRSPAAPRPPAALRRIGFLLAAFEPGDDPFSELAKRLGACLRRLRRDARSPDALRAAERRPSSRTRR